MSDLKNLIEKVDFMSGRIIEPEHPSLEHKEADEATKELVKHQYRSVVRLKADPELRGQRFGIISMMPSARAKPDSHGIYGTFKLRGNYSSVEEAEEAARDLIKNVDSQNHYLICRVGQDTPFTAERKFVEDETEVDLSEQVESIQRQNTVNLKKKEKEEIKLIKEREQALLKESNQVLNDEYEIEPFELYKVMQTKRANLEMVQDSLRNRLQKEIEPLLIRVRKDIAEQDRKNKTFRQRYKDDIAHARKAAGLPHEFKAEDPNSAIINYL